jgi:hypothetical protein
LQEVKRHAGAQSSRAIRNPLEKKIELARALGFPERVFTDLWDLIPILRLVT